MKVRWELRDAQMRNLLILTVLFATSAFGQTPEIARARNLYQRTDYEAALRMLADIPGHTAPVYILTGQCQYMLGEFKKASEALEQAVRLAPDSGEAYLWLGRAYGRRAETSTFLTAPGLAKKAGASFERAVALEPRNQNAVSDLFEYYMEAPGFLGGGMDKAQELAERMRASDPSEYHFRMGMLADKRKEYKDAEEQLRRSVDLAPLQVNRLIELGKFLAKNGQYDKSDAAFRQAAQVAPNDPSLIYEQAIAYIRAKRNLGVARDLLVRYLNSPLTPDLPPRSDAERLLRQVGS